MPDVSSTQPADVRLFVSLDVHKLSIVAATLPPTGGGQPEVARIETTEKAVRRFINKLGGPEGLAGLLRGGAWRVCAVAAVEQYGGRLRCRGSVAGSSPRR
ncbi:MAG: hypothetical protein JOY58_03765 [Solirubrobacterales bacterium]|nr:hypothetical protein [Solirubrobacterales bacterium]